MPDKLKFLNIFYTNELTFNELLDDYTEFIAIKLFQERRILDEEKQK